MAKALYYSPRLERSLIAPLYRAAKAQRIAMTTLTSQFVAQGLARLAEDFRSVVAEEQPKRDSTRAK
jgi:hypothetical protein